MNAGALDRRITILRQGPAVDDGYTTTPGEWDAYISRWASWKPANGREVLENQGRTANTGGTFWLRYDSETATITTLDRVQWEGRDWDIVSANLLNRNDGIELIVSVNDEG